MTTRREWVTVVIMLISVLAVIISININEFDERENCETELALANKVIAAYKSGQCKSGLPCRIIEVGVSNGEQ